MLHVASPFPSHVPKNQDELIVPAREGTLRALRAAKVARTVKRVVVTSSFAAVGYGHLDRGPNEAFTEVDWTVLDNPASTVPPYQKSKTVSERAAWDWMAKEGGEMGMAVINPVGIYGPILSKDYSTSVEVVVRLINGQMPGVPDVNLGVVDVRDVADLHLRAMVDPKANGERFIAISANSSIKDIAVILRNRLGEKAKNVPTRRLPNWLLNLVGIFDPQVAMLALELGKSRASSGEKAKKLLGWQPRTGEEAIAATAESLAQFGLLK